MTIGSFYMENAEGGGIRDLLILVLAPCVAPPGPGEVEGVKSPCELSLLPQADCGCRATRGGTDPHDLLNVTGQDATGTIRRRSFLPPRTPACVHVRTRTQAFPRNIYIYNSGHPSNS